MEKKQEILKMMDILMEDLTEEQKERIESVGKQLGDISLNDISPKKAMEIVDRIGFSRENMEKLQKKSRRRRAEEKQKNKVPKIGRNQKCLCGSGKKYKKCCGLVG